MADSPPKSSVFIIVSSEVEPCRTAFFGGHAAQWDHRAAFRHCHD
jgi:hypothetical protein